MASLLVFLRQRWVGFPLHPLGYAMTCSYGDLIWFPFLLVWLLKSLVLRYGGHIGIDTLQTRFPGVYAVGDVATAGVPKAGVFAEGAARVVAQTLLGLVGVLQAYNQIFMLAGDLFARL